jgi:hypothetical protein
MDARETDDKLGAEPPDGVVSAPRLNDHKGQISKVWHLRTKEISDDLLVYLNLVFVHANRH